VDLQKSSDATPAPAAPPVELRASDADRDRITDILREAVAEGRLTAEEHAERVEGVLATKTVGELDRFVRDLPAAHTGRATPAYASAPNRPTAGAIPVDAAAVDFYAFSCQKWLCGPDATGGLVVRDPEALAVTAPSYLSQQAYEPTGSFTPRDGAARFDSNWTPVPSLAGLSAALDMAPEGRFERAAELTARCRELLAERVELVTAPDQATLVTFRAEGDTRELVHGLYDAGVVVRDIPGLGWVRVSCGWWTSEEDLDRLVGALP